MTIFEYLKSIKTDKEMAMFLTYHNADIDAFEPKPTYDWLKSECCPDEEIDGMTEFFNEDFNEDYWDLGDETERK